MSKYHLTSLDHRSLSNAQFSQLISSSLAVLADFSKTNKTESFYAKQVPQLEKKLDIFDAGLHKTRASQTAKQLEQADKARDRALATITKLVRAYSSVTSDPIATSYKVLSEALKPYKITSKMTYEEQSGVIRHLLKELGQGKYRTAIASLHLADHITSLRTAQATFEEKYKERLTEQVTKTPSQTKALRQEIYALYRLLLDYTAINAVAHPEKAYLTSLRDDLNSIRKRYKTNSSKKKVEPMGQEQN